MFSYRLLFKQAWLVTWRHKYLWFFGLFAAVVAGSGSWEYQVFSQSLNQGLIEGSYQRLANILALEELGQNFWYGLGDLANYDFWTISSAISLIIITFTLLAFALWLAVTSQAALVGETKKILNPKKKAQILSIRTGLTDGHGHFWSLAGLNLLIKFLVTLSFFLISLPLLFMSWQDTNLLAIVYTILFVVFIPVAVSLSLIIKFAIAYRVLDNKSALMALEKGEQLFRQNWLVSLEAAIILFIINFLASAILLIILSLFFLPIFVVSLLLSAAWLSYAILFLAIILVILFGSALTTFQVSAWTNLFLSLTQKGGQAKLERLFGKKSA